MLADAGVRMGLTNHVGQAEGVAGDGAGEQGGDDALEAVGDVPGGEAVPHAREERHALRLVPRPHLRNILNVSCM